MAKRRKLTTPSADDLEKLEAEFRRETSAPPGLAPIAQVAAEAAQSAPVVDAETRALQARNAADAQTLTQARDKGLLMVDVPVDEIAETDMIRDRMILSEAEMTELRLSIAASGLRLPIEIYPLATPQDGLRYGLLSGYRRLLAVRGLRELTGDAKYATIKALVRPATDSAEALVSMVEENEIRSDLSQYERGRVAVISAQNGAFVNVEEAVNRLFVNASKAKRSKIRSFAFVHEELGDMLAFPETLTEKQGLRLAAALRNGMERKLRDALADVTVDEPTAEWAAIEAVLETAEAPPKPSSRGGRPAKRTPPEQPGVLHTSTGWTLRRVADDRGYSIRIEGRPVDGDMIDAIMAQVQRLLEAPDR